MGAARNRGAKPLRNVVRTGIYPGSAREKSVHCGGTPTGLKARGHRELLVGHAATISAEPAASVAAWAEQKAVREIMVFLHSHGVGTARAVRIYKR